MLVLGVDPGLQITGYGLIKVSASGEVNVVEAGVIRTSQESGIAERLHKIYGTLDTIVSENRPEVLVLEKIYSHVKHPATSILMGHARGVICLLCGIKGIRLVNYPSTRIKKAITGKGQASKEQMQRVVTSRLRLKTAPEPVDVTDALGIALSFVQIEFVEKKMRELGNDIKGKRQAQAEKR